eukprot:360531-Chlamydomonas_euryale.AAC.6
MVRSICWGGEAVGEASVSGAALEYFCCGSSSWERAPPRRGPRLDTNQPRRRSPQEAEYAF